MFDEFNKLMDRIFNKDPEEYDRIQDATSRIEEIDDEEWSEIYDSASSLGKKAMDAFSHDFADGAVGGPWREGTDFED